MRPITIERPFDCPLTLRDRDGIWLAGTVAGIVEISHEPDGPTWISDLWIAAEHRDTRAIKLIPINHADRDLFDVIAAAVEEAHASQFDEWLECELAHLEERELARGEAA